VGAAGVALNVLRRILVLVAVALATLGGGLLALSTFAQTKRLSAGTVRLSVAPFHDGALDVYVPLVDWGVRFDAVRLPARLQADVRAIDRRAVTRVATAGSLDVALLRREARDAIAGYLKALVAMTVAAAVGLGVLATLALRGGWAPRTRWGLATSATLAIATGIALIVLLPPRGTLDEPMYYAFGPDIPRALEAVESVERSTRNLDQELDAQLVGLARLLQTPGQRASLQGRPQVTVASDLHNNVFSLSTLERTAGDGPLLFPGDLTDRGSPLETSLIRRVIRTGHPFVFASGNHDSDSLVADLARRGATVLTQFGRLKPDGTYGPVVNDIRGLKIAGYSDPYERRNAEDFRDRYDRNPTSAMKEEFLAWVRPLLGRVDVVLVHEPALLEPTLAILRDEPPSRPVVFVVGHTHEAAVVHYPGVAVINGGSVGAGGTGNLAERIPIGIARLTYTVEPSFQPLAADLVSIDPGNGSATAQRQRLDAAGATPADAAR